MKTEGNTAERLHMRMSVVMDGKHKRQSMLRACKRIKSGNRRRKAKNETKKCSDGEEDKFGKRHVDCMGRSL